VLGFYLRTDGKLGLIEQYLIITVFYLACCFRPDGVCCIKKHSTIGQGTAVSSRPGLRLAVSL